MRLWAALLCLRLAQGAVELNVGALFPLSAEGGGWAGGEAGLPAAQMALQDINDDPNVLQGYLLRMHHFDSQCQPGLGGKHLYELLYTEPTKLLLLSGCSLVTTLVAETAHLWNLLVLSYGASSPALSNRDRFPTLFRTHPSATFHNPARVSLFLKFNWKKIAVLQSVEEVFTSTAKDLERRCREAGLGVTFRQSFLGDPTDAVANLGRQDPRIIVGLFYEIEARRVFCQVYKAGLYGRRYVWFLIGWYSDQWFLPVPGEGLNCTAEQMTEAAAFHLTTEAVMLSENPQPGVSGKTGAQFETELRARLPKAANATSGFVEAPLAYDALWAVALAFQCTQARLAKSGQRLEDFRYDDQEMAAQLQGCMNQTNFTGVSGRVMFSETGDRIMVAQIEQMVEGQYVQLGTFDHERPPGAQLELRVPVRFAGLSAPPDSTPTRVVFRVVSRRMYVGFGCVAAVGVLICLACLLFNAKYSYRKVVFESLPGCNSAMLLGGLFCILSLFLLGLPADGIPLHRDNFTLLCHGGYLLEQCIYLLGGDFSVTVTSLVTYVVSPQKTQSVLPDPDKSDVCVIEIIPAAMKLSDMVIKIETSDDPLFGLANKTGSAPTVDESNPPLRGHEELSVVSDMQTFEVVSSSSSIKLSSPMWSDLECEVKTTGDVESHWAEIPIDEDDIQIYYNPNKSRIAFLMIGFSLAYGAMFAKVWLVHRRGAPANADGTQVNATMSLMEMVAKTVGRFDPDIQRAKDERDAVAKRRATRALQAVGAVEWAGVVAVLVGVDVVVLLAWALADPMERHEERFPITRPTRDSLYDYNTLPVLQHCRSLYPNVWLSLTLGWKGLLLILGLFLAYEGRHLKLRHVNDSRFVNMSVYNVAILCLVTGPIVTFLIQSEQDAAFGFVASTVLVCVLMSLGLVFLPKILAVTRLPPTQAEREGRRGTTARGSILGDAPPPSKKLTRDEERKIAELRAEHEDILRQIAEKDAKIAEVKEVLARRRASRAAEAKATTTQASVEATTVKDASAEALLGSDSDVLL